MRQRFKLIVSLICLLTIISIAGIYHQTSAKPEALNERTIESKLSALLNAATENYTRRNTIADKRNELTLQTMGVLGRAGCIALLNRADYIKKDFFSPHPIQQTTIITEPGPNGIGEKKITRSIIRAKSKEARLQILNDFDKIASASFSSLDEEGIAVRITHDSEILYTGTHTPNKNAPLLSYSREILFPVGGTTLPLTLTLQIEKSSAEPMQIRDSRFSSWLQDNNVLYGIYWADINGALQPLWHNEPADELLSQLHSSLVPWPKSYTSKQMSIGEEVISIWIKPKQHKGDTAIALALYQQPKSTMLTLFLWGVLALQAALLLMLISINASNTTADPAPKQRPKGTNRNTNISTLRNDTAPAQRRASPIAQQKRSRNSDIVRDSFEKEGTQKSIRDVTNVNNDVLQSLLKKMRS